MVEQSNPPLNPLPLRYFTTCCALPPVVLGVDPPVHLQVVTRGHLQPPHPAWVAGEVRHVVQTPLQSGDK